MDPVLSHHTSQDRQPAAVQKLPNNQLYRSPKQSHAEDRTEQIEAISGEDHRWRRARLQNRKKYHRADLQPTNPLWEISPAPAISLPWFHRLQVGLLQGFACSFVGNREEVQHQHQPYPSHLKPLWQGHQCSPLQRQNRRLVPNNSWSPTGISTLIHFLSYISGKDHALEDHEGTVSIGGRTITNLRYADDIDGLAGEKEKGEI